MVQLTFASWLNGAHSDPVEIPLADTALIVVDMQNVYLREPYFCGITETPAPFAAAIPGTVRLVEAAREVGVPVIFTRYVYLPDNADRLDARPRVPVPPGYRTLEFGSPEIEIIPELKPKPEEIVIDKSRTSSFYGTRLEPYLTARRIRNLVISGITTSVCLESTVRDASERGYQTYVIEDAAGEAELSCHWHALYTMEWIYGTVCTVEDVQRSWGVPVTGVPEYPFRRGGNVVRAPWEQDQSEIEDG